MTLPQGKRLGPYEIVSRIGSGGMGEVFRARDTRLERTVAVKTLPAALATNAQMRERLQREAKAISSLSHPNICALFDIGEQDGVHYLVMEHLEGETLAERIERGPLPLREALRYGIEIANALERAHRAGVIHRDLKPGNVMLTKSGAKLLDFGLAKAVEEEKGVSADAPTMQAKQPLTAEGTIVGTFQYMAPEQLEAAPADPRTDIFALGAVLYEMVTGQRAFSGKTRTSLIASIVAATPRPMSELQPVTPGALENVVARCLEKDPDARWQSAHDVRLELEYITRQLDAPAARAKRNVLPWAIAALASVIAIGAGSMALRNARITTPARRVHAQILPPPGRELVNAVESLSISPDGQFVTFRVRSDQRLWLRSIASNDARPLDGTEGAGFPFWSPDSRSIGFVARGKLKKVSVSGTPPAIVCDAPKGRPGTWSSDGVILFAPSSLSPLHRVPAGGGTPVAVTKLEGKETTHRWPQFLPDGKHFLYLAASHSGLATEEGSIYVTSLDSPTERALLLRARSNAVYANGHLLYAKGRQLLAHPFDAGARKLTGDPIPLLSDVEYHLELFRSSFAVAQDGAVVFHAAANREEAVLMRHAPPSPPEEVMQPRLNIVQLVLAPDRRKVAARVSDPETGAIDLWILDLEQKSKSRLTTTPDLSEWNAAWSPDSKRLAFSRAPAMNVAKEIVVKSIDGGEADRVVHSEKERSTMLSDWSDDGRFLLFTTLEAGNDSTADMFVRPLADGAKPIPVAATGAAEWSGSFSPDGNWIVYESDHGGKSEMYALRFPSTGSSPIPLGTSDQTWWSGDTLLTFGEEGVGTLSAVITPETFRLSPRKSTMAWPGESDIGDSDGKMMIYMARKPDAYTQSIGLVTHWRPK